MTKSESNAHESDAVQEIERSIVGGRFQSRKNRVFKTKYAGEVCVAKIFSEELRGRERSEFSILKICSKNGVRVPKPIKLLDGAILMELIDGANVADLFDSYWSIDPSGGSVRRELSMLLGAVAEWLSQFHSASNFKLARGDAILRNFVLKGGEVWGMDFEEAQVGDPLADVGQTCSNILGLEPKFVPLKFELSRDFASAYWKLSGKDRADELPAKVAEALRHYARFRQDGRLLEEWASRIETDGLDQ
jgi:tRNA A-37 threonylcarbamoyl transferase component Bud32